MRLLQCIFYNNRCYQAGAAMVPTKIVLHTTAANNKKLSRYVQPHDGQSAGMGEVVPGSRIFTREEMMALLGTNKYANDWNRPCDASGAKLSKCVHAFVGLLADKSIATVQTLSWDMQCWGVGKGSRGSYNTCALQFEILEDDHSDGDYCRATFEEAAQLCAYWMTLYPTITEIVSHHEAGQRGYGSGHIDPDNWWPTHGLTMDLFRARVAEILAAAQPPEPEETPTPAPQEPDEEEVRKMEQLEEALKRAEAYEKTIAQMRETLSKQSETIRTLTARYNTLNAVPEWGRETIRKLLDGGSLQGKAEGKLDLSEDMVRILVILDRSGKL